MKREKSYGQKPKRLVKLLIESGTVYSSADRKELALRDAENRLSTGGELFSSDGIDLFGGDDKRAQENLLVLECP